MTFNSSEFLIFFPVCLIVYAIFFQRDRLRDISLLIASYVFYMSWNWRYLGLLLFATVLDFYIARWLDHEQRPSVRKRLMILTITVNLGILGIFKYYNFFVNLGQHTSTLFGLTLNIPTHQLLLPLGISFYTFETLSYTIDVYRRRIGAEKSLLRYALYIAFWPHLVAGPIVRAADLLPQMRRKPNVSRERFQQGLLLIIQGLFKKIVIADLLAGLAVDAVFADPGRFSSWDLLIVLYGYAFQIYNDFSGYTDIAIGAARILGYDILPNFNRPYIAASVREFWTRWHISLSTWLRDYLYIELGGNRQGSKRTYVNLMITMLLGGLWHGAALNFVLWGAFHGVMLVLSHVFAATRVPDSPWVKLRKRFFTFHIVVFGWLLFRVRGMEQFLDYVRNLFTFTLSTQIKPAFYLILLLAAVLHFVPRPVFETYTGRISSQPAWAQAAFYSVALLVLCALTLGGPSFIYFQF